MSALGEVTEPQPQKEPEVQERAFSRKSAFRIRGSTFLWWLVPVAAIVLVLLSSYVTLSARRYPAANAVVGEMLAGQTVGQTFVSRYPNLSGVELQIGTYREGSGPAKASLVLHLRAAPTPGPDLATARLASGQALGENPWYLFSFPPIPDSQDRTFYIEVESPDGQPGSALTLFQWKPVAQSDPYPQGTAYSNGKPQRGDLAFGLRYSSSPLDAWAQMGRAASVNFPPVMMLLLGLAGLAGVAWTLLRLPWLLRSPQRRHTWLVRWSLPTVLTVALVNGLTYLLLIPPWQGPDEHSHFAYVAVLDRYGQSNKVEQLRLGKETDQALIDAMDASMNRHDFSRRVAWHSAPGAAANPGPTLFQQLRQPPAYYWLCAATLRLARSVGVPVDPYANPEGALKLVRGVSLTLSLGVVALAWLTGLLLSPGGSIWLRLLLPLTVALLPMHAFIASVANNDIMAEFAVSALFVALLALFRWPTGVRAVALATVTVALATVATTTKSTATAAVVPLLSLGLLLWVGTLIYDLTRRLSALGEGSRLRIADAVPIAFVLMIFISGISIGFLAYAPQDRAAGWYARYRPIEYAARTETTTARDGSYVMQLAPPGRNATASQVLVPPVYHPEFNLTVAGWARLSPDQSGSPSQPAKVAISVEEGARQAGVAEVTLERPGEWVPITTTARISASAERVILRIVAEEAAAQLDGFSLRVDGLPIWNDSLFKPHLLNSSAETTALGLRPELAKVMPQEFGQIASVLANPQPFDRGALWAYYADEQHRSFWGNFGWASVPLPPILYTILFVLWVMALVGLAWKGIACWARWSAWEWLGLVSVLTLAVVVLIGFARQMTLLVVEGNAAYPQGRYLFVLVIPIAWLLLSGLRNIWSLAKNGVLSMATLRRTEQTGGPPQAAGGNSQQALPWGVWVCCNALLAFAGYCLLSLIAPYYYG